MIWSALLPLLLLTAPARAQQNLPPPPPEQTFTLPRFTEGLCTRYSANVIPDSALAESLNVLIDEDAPGVVVRRRGYAKYNATAITNTKNVRGLWAFDANDGTKYLVGLSSAAFYKSTGDGSFTAITGLSGFSSSSEWNCTSTLGKLWCADGNTIFYWDGASTATVTTAPSGTLIDRFRNRVVVSGISGSRARVRLSGELDGIDWTSGIASTSPANIAVGGVNDGNVVTCLMGAYQDVFLIGKLDSLWGLYGFGRNDFELRELSREVGCLEQKSVQEKNNCLYWVSKRGVERMCGNQIERISDPIRDQIDTIIASAGNAVTVTDTSQSDFEAGQLSPSGFGTIIYSTITLGAITPSTWTRTDTADSDFTSGTLTTVSTTPTSGSLTMEQAAGGSFTNAGAESNDCTNYRQSDGVCDFTRSAGAASYGSLGWETTVTCGDTARFFIRTTDTVVIHTVLSAALTNGYDSTFTVNLATQPYKMIEILAGTGTGLNPPTNRSVAFIRPNTMTVRIKDSDAGATCAYSYDISESVLTTSGDILSQTFNTNISTPIYGEFSTDFSSTSTGRLTFQTQTSADGSSFDSLVAATPGSLVSATKQYLRYKANWAVDSTTNTPADLQRVTLYAGTTGQFISQCRNPGTSISSWGNLSCNYVANGGTLDLEVSTGVSCHAVTRTTAPWTSQTNNSVIGVPTAPFVAYRAIFASTSPVLQDCSISWNEGATRPPAASMIYRDRYHLAYTTSTTSGADNDHIFLLDRFDKWTLFDNHNCYSLALYQRKPYCGSSSDNGRVYLMDSGTDDDGSSFTSRIKTRAFDMGAPDARKSFRLLSLDLEPAPNTSDSISLAASYILDRTTTSFSLGSTSLTEDTGVILAEHPFSLDNPVTGRFIQLSIEGVGTNQPSRIFGGRLDHYILPRDQ